MLLSDDDIYELFKTFDLAFQELKDNDIINNYTLKIVNKVIIFKFICLKKEIIMIDIKKY